MVAVGLTHMTAAHTSSITSDQHDELALGLCIGGLFGVFAVGYPGYFVFDAVWPSFYYSPIDDGKNAWLIGQAIFIGVYVEGMVLGFATVNEVT